jgi:DNA-binding beta-propeller fold protein YncE
MTTAFSAVNATTGAVTTLTSTASFVASGVGVSLDGTNIYAAQGSQFVVLPNQ